MSFFSGDAWVFGNLLQIETPASETKTFKAYSSPDKNSRVKEILKPIGVYELKNCSGDWVQIGSAKGEVKRTVNTWLQKGSYCGNYDYCNADFNIFSPEDIEKDSAENFAGKNATTCQFAAFITDPTSGVFVRAGAGADNAVIKTIPEDSGGTLVFIEVARGDWLKISSAVNSTKTKVFSGKGWIYAPLVSVKLAGYEGFEKGQLKVYQAPD